MSKLALRALENAVSMNPDGARLFLAILRTAPDAVKYKPEDRFGPLAMMVTESAAVPEPSAGLRCFTKPALPTKLHRAAERFQRQWISKRFTKAELADELELCLRELGESVPVHAGGWHTLGTAEVSRPDPLGRIFPSS